jgi:superoxide dismutase, Fe-Mn family
MIHILPKLSYSYDALEPHIDTKTMEIHHGKHHQTYVNNLNAVLEKYQHLADGNIMEMLRGLSKLSMEDTDKTVFANNAGGHLNHTFFWTVMGPKKTINETLRDEVKKEFGSLEEFKKLFFQTAIGRFGSGWAWLVRDEKGKLSVYSTPNQDSPYALGHTPIITLDVWEHAYYLKYQNRRADYIDAWWNVLKIL